MTLEKQAEAWMRNCDHGESPWVEACPQCFAAFARAAADALLDEIDRLKSIIVGMGNSLYVAEERRRRLIRPQDQHRCNAAGRRVE